jgi:hypothetical protein
MIPDNLRIYPKQPATFALAPNPAIITFPLHTLHLLPPAIHHTIVCLSLNHFINSLPSGTDREIALTNRSKVYHHRGAALRALGQYIAQDKTRCGDLTIVSILMFLCLEVSLPSSSFVVYCSGANWMGLYSCKTRHFLTGGCMLVVCSGSSTCAAASRNSRKIHRIWSRRLSFTYCTLFFTIPYPKPGLESSAYVGSASSTWATPTVPHGTRCVSANTHLLSRRSRTWPTCTV